MRSWLLLLLLAVFGSSAFAQGLSPGNPVSLGSVDIHHTVTKALTFSTTPGGADIQSVTVTTEGVAGKDFALVSATGCIGTLPYPDQCTIVVKFTPQQIGVRFGALIITNTSGTVVNLINLSGIGVGPQFVFQPATFTALSTATGLTPATFTAGASVQDPSGDTIFTDIANDRILEETYTGLFSVLYSGSPLALTETSGLALDGVGNVYVSSGNSVYILAPGATTLTTLATPGVTLSHPTGLALDTAGDLYIADSTNNAIYQVVLGGNFAQAITLTGAVTTLNRPTGLAIDANNTLYIADSGDNQIVEVPVTSGVTTVFQPSSLTLTNPTGVAVDAAGTIYIADTGNSRIVEATVQGDQFVLSPVTLDIPSSVLVEANGDLIVSDNTLGLVTVVRSTATVNFPTATVVGTPDTTDNPEHLTVQETGNISSTLNAGTDPALTGTNPTAFLVANTSTCPVLTGGAPTGADTFSIGQVCTYGVNFQPTVVGPNLANLVLSTTAAGGLTATSSASLYGLGLNTLNHFTLVAISNPASTPTTVNLGGSVELVLTAINADGTVATDYTGTVTFTTTDSNGVYQGGTGAATNTTTYTLTAANNGVLTIPVASGLQLNQYGVWTATATADPATVPPGATGTAVSNDIYVIDPSTLVLTSSVNPSLVNQTTIFTLTVTATGSGTVTPTGSVTFYSNGVAIGTSILAATGNPLVSTASLPPYSFATAGSYPITATYTPTSTSQGGTAALTQLVGNQAGITLTSSINPSLVGQSTNLTASISSLPVFGAATGTIQFFDGATSLGTVPVSGAAATLAVSFSTAGTHTLTAVYTSSNPNITSGTSGPYAQHVLNVAALGLTSSVNPSLPGQNTTLTATLTALGTPTGTVKFYDGATLIGTQTLTGNSASVSVSFTTTGNHILTAVYSGDTLTETITSPPLTQVVLYATSVTLTSSVNPVTVNANTLLTATVKPAAGAPTPGGSVIFKSNGVAIGTGTVNGGVATLTTSFPLPGIYTLTAVYSGDANNQPGTSNAVLETVLNVVSINLTSSVNPVFLDNPTVLTATLTTAAAGTTPSGTVSFLDGTTPIGTAAVVNGIASINASFVYAGTHSITALYSGDTADAPSTTPAYSQVVADFTLTVASGGSSTGSTIAGGSTSYSLVVTPVITSTLPGPITLTFSGLPSTITGTLTPSTIAAGSGATPVSFAVTAAPISLTSHLQRPRNPAHRSPLGYAPTSLALLALPLAWFRRRKRFASLLASICLLVAITAGLSGCMSDPSTGYYGQTPQTYNLTVTATSGNLTRSTYLTLTVQ
ncbi:MAG: Ig-like domain repeat protein [Acidobacteriaceae bacterium]